MTELATDGMQLGANIRTFCHRRGWDLSELADRAGVSRTTLYNLERGRTRRLYGATLRRIASALEVRPEQLWDASDLKAASVATGPAFLSERDVHQQREFDRRTNQVVAQMAADSPGMFAGWDSGDWDELYSQFGVGGAMSTDGVREAAAKLNRRRALMQQLAVVMETHLADVAAEMIESMYRSVRASSPAENVASAERSAADA